MNLRLLLVLVTVLSYVAIGVTWFITNPPEEIKDPPPPFFYTLSPDDLRNIQISTGGETISWSYREENRRWFFDDLEDVDRAPVRIGVNAGGHLERVATSRFTRAVLVSIPNNLAVRRALAEGGIDAAVTDTLEAPRWREGLDDAVVLGPFTRDRKAYLVRAELSALASDLDAWLLEREADGGLAALREEHFGASAKASAQGSALLTALLAAIDERLALMPLVGLAKRRDGLPLEVPDREAVVLDAAVASALAAAKRAGVAPPPEAAIRSLFRAQMEAAKRVQWAAVRDPELEQPESLPDVQSVLRPALLRIGDRVSRLAISLPAGLDAATVRRAAKRELRTQRLPEASRNSIADAIAVLSAAVGATPVSQVGP